MPERTPSPSVSPDTGVSAGLLVASAMVPETFARSLSARSAVDQGIVTGLSTGLHYLLTVGTQDTLQAVAAELAANTPPGAERTGGRGNAALTLLADLAAIPLGLAVQRALPPRPGEPMLRGALRQSGWRVAVTGLGGALLLATQAGARAAGRPARGRGSDRVLPGGGAGRPRASPTSWTGAARRARRRGSGRARRQSVEPAFARGRRRGGGRPGRRSRTASTSWPTLAGRRLASVLPGGPQLWKLAGHGVALALLGGGAVARVGPGDAQDRGGHLGRRCRCSRRTRRPGGPGRR